MIYTIIGLLGHHTLGEEPLEGLVCLHQIYVPKELGKKAGIEEVEYRVLDPADVLVNIHPVVRFRGVKGKAGRMWAAVSLEVPG